MTLQHSIRSHTSQRLTLKNLFVDPRPPPPSPVGCPSPGGGQKPCDSVHQRAFLQGRAQPGLLLPALAMTFRNAASPLWGEGLKVPAACCWGIHCPLGGRRSHSPALSSPLPEPLTVVRRLCLWLPCDLRPLVQSLWASNPSPATGGRVVSVPPSHGSLGACPGALGLLDCPWHHPMGGSPVPRPWVGLS